MAATVSKDAPTIPAYTQMAVTTVSGQATKMGVMEFDLVGVSRSIIRGNTRVKLLLTVDSIKDGEEVDIALALLPNRMRYPVTWETMESYAAGGYRDHVIDNAGTEIGSHVAFDITELFESKLDGKTETIAFSIHAHENSDAVVFGVHHVAEDYFPRSSWKVSLTCISVLHDELFVANDCTVRFIQTLDWSSCTRWRSSRSRSSLYVATFRSSSTENA